MAPKKEKLKWLDHPVRDEEHQRDLELKAAIYQFHHGMDRTQAEHRVKHEDRVERHQKAAAHHLDGMRAANAIGNHEDAQQHHAMYSLHVKALGLNPDGAVHPDVTKWQGEKAEKRAYTFKGHDDDQFLVQPVHEAPPLAKSDDERPPAEVIPIEEGHTVRELNQAVQTRKQRKLDLRDHLDALRSQTTPDGIQGAKSKLLDYLKSIGIEGASIEEGPNASFEVPAQVVARPPLRVFSGQGVASAPKFGHLRVVKHEEWPHILAMWTDLAKDETGKQGRVKQFDVRKTWLRHKHLPEEKAFDYSSWLTPEHQQAGYRMFVLSHGNGNPVRVHVLHQNRKAGFANGNVDQGDLEVENYQLMHGGGHENRGLEASMLNAMMGHAKNNMQADYLSHAPFMPAASALIEAVAKPHGFQLGEVEDIDEGEKPMDQPAARAVGPGVKMRSQTGRTPRSFTPRIHRWWATADEEND